MKYTPSSINQEMRPLNHSLIKSKVDHPFYKNTWVRKRSIGVDPFKNMQWFDEDPYLKQSVSPTKKKSPTKVFKNSPK